MKRSRESSDERDEDLKNLRKKREDEETFLIACEGGDLDLVKRWLSLGKVNVEAKDNLRGRSGIHFAAANGHVDVVTVLLKNDADVNAVNKGKETALHYAAKYGCVDVAKVLLQNGADVNAAVAGTELTALRLAADKKHIPCTLQLLCFGAEIDEQTIKEDKTKLLRPIENRLTLLRNGNRMGLSFMSDEERRFMWNLAFFFTIKHRAAAFKAYYAIRSFITFNGIFMGPGYDLGNGNIWNKE